jgi:hypothetical protein
MEDRSRFAPKAKLDEDKVRAIRKDERAYRLIAADYGITKAYVGTIKRGAAWQWVK